MNTWSKAQFALAGLTRWLCRMAADHFRKVDAPLHILFCTVDHFEPGTGGVTPAEERRRMDQLLADYPKLVDSHRDNDNYVPRRTWFFPPHYHRYGNLKDLVSLCARGYGEIELHLHHGKSVPDTAENLRATILQTVREYSSFGIFGTEDGQRRYGFIHGDWALANSRRNQYCGVNSEIKVLRETGCYADFTFPAVQVPEANPRKINAIYYATDDATRPKSHRTGRDVARGTTPSGDLMMVEGCVHPYFLDGRLTGLRLVGDGLEPGSLGVTPKRLDLCVRTGIHVKGKRNWVFIKTHTHGATDSSVVTAQPMADAFSYLEQHYNDGKRYVLHYVTARELYNIVKAVEAAEPGENPDAYRNYRIAPPQYDTSGAVMEASEELRALVAKTYSG